MIEGLKITPEALKEKLKPFSEGTVLGQMISRVNLQTDKDGNVLPHVLGNIRTAIYAVQNLAPDLTVKSACANTLQELRSMFGE